MFCISYVEFSGTGDVSPLNFNVSFYQCGLNRYLVYTLGNNLIVLHFDVLVLLAVVIGSSFSCLLCYFLVLSLWDFCLCVCLFSASLLPGTTRCCKLIMYNPWPSSRINYFSMGLWFFLLENATRNLACS